MASELQHLKVVVQPIDGQAEIGLVSGVEHGLLPVERAPA
jgi:hypothetical protein